jgi:hypothetical protein
MTGKEGEERGRKDRKGQERKRGRNERKKRQERAGTREGRVVGYARKEDK